MSRRSRVPFWTPPLRQALRLSLRPALTFQLFSFSGMCAIVVALALTERNVSSSVSMQLALAFATTVVGVFLGQLVALLRVRTIVMAMAVSVGATVAPILAVMMFAAHLGETFQLAMVIVAFFFPMAFGCGFLSLQHRWELMASFWPAVGWIGAALVLLEGSGRVQVWEKSKGLVWTPLPLLFLGGFILSWIAYLMSKQALRVELWQALSGSSRRRLSTTATVSALPRRNVLPMAVLALLLAATVAALAPYLWRTSNEHQDGGHGQTEPTSVPSWNADSVLATLAQLLEALKATKPLVMALLLLVVLYRPAKRALLLRHLRRPLIPTPPTERIENLWEYVRIASEDAGTQLAASDSVEQITQRIDALGRASPALSEAARIYSRTRYGFTVARGDVATMHTTSMQAARELRHGLSVWSRIRAAWRPLS